MDREALKRWLHHPRYTWRWRPEPAQSTGEDEYCAVEATETELRWYRWSHEIADGGERDVQRQSVDDFRAAGPCRPVPEHVLAELRAWVDTHAK